MNLFPKLQTFLFPERCPFCGKVIDKKEIACNDCRSKFPEKYIECFTYGGYTCVSSFPYEGIFKKCILNMKFHSKPYYAKKMGIIMAEDIRNFYKGYSFDIITSVPLHRKRKRKRGYNQSELLAKEIAAELNIPYKEILFKQKDNAVQHTLSGEKRIKNVKGAYLLVDKSLVKDKNILIIDDIITTGCTLGECSKIIFKGKANLVSCGTFCRVV